MKDYGRQNSEHISVGNWLLTLLLMAIPGVNLVAGLIYLCGRKKSKRNYVIALILIWVIVAVLLVGAYFILKQFFGTTLDSILGPVRTFMADKNIPFPLMLNA